MSSSFSPSDVTVVSVSYKSAPVLERMIASLPDGVKVIIVDNACEDAEALEALSGRLAVKVLTPKKNLGFGRACNLGAQKASTEFLLFLNPDAAVEPGSIEAFLEAAGRYGPQTAYTPKIANSDGSPNFKRRSVLLPRSEWMPRGWPEEECEVPVVSGAAIFVRRAYFETVRFDPAIFMYHEDDDWSLQVRADGGRLIFVPGALVVHQSGHSSGRDDAITRFKAYHLGRSKVYAFGKHEIPYSKPKLLMQAFGQLLLPHNLISSRKRAKHLGFLEGVLWPHREYRSPKDIKNILRLPLWKVKRELSRPFKQLRPLPSRIASYLFGARYFDCLLAHRSKFTEGQVAANGRVAVYLIFPGNGLLASHVAALNYLNENGYAPLVVSNIPLQSADRERLRGLSWLCIERENFGYDFGGYRDGILTALKRLGKIDRLVLVNDSSWFPLPGSQDWLAQAEAMDLDFVGAASNYGHSRVDAADFRDINWNYRTTHKNFHYCSYALMFSSRLTNDPQFCKFWRKFPLTNSKKVTVRRGEIGLSKWVISNGFTHGMTTGIFDLDKVLSGLSQEEMRKVAQDIIIPEAPQLSKLRRRLLSENSSAEDLASFVLTAVAGQGSSYVLPVLLHERFGFAFLKKSPVWLNEEASDTTIEFAKRLVGEFGKVIAAEAAEVRRTRAPGFADSEGVPEEPAAP